MSSQDAEWDETAVRSLHGDLVELHGAVGESDAHGADSEAEPGEGVRQLLTTILSQNVADENTARASESLFATYDDFRAIEDAPHDELAETIRVAGLPDTKATRIQRALSSVREETLRQLRAAGFAVDRTVTADDPLGSGTEFVFATAGE